jgi:hypothetical protein
MVLGFRRSDRRFAGTPVAPLVNTLSKELMMKIISVLFAVLATVAVPALASAQPSHAANSPKAEFILSEPLVVGSETLEPGIYKFQCKKIGDEEFLVVTSADDGREVARVPCRPEQLQKKTEISEFRSVPRPDGIHALSSVRIKGETIAHRVATN